VKVAFEYADEAGLVARKVFGFRPDSYVVEVTATVSVGPKRLNPTVQLGPGLGDLGVEAAGNSYIQAAGAILHQNGKVRRVAAKNLGTRPVEEGTFRFGGIDDQYFLAVALPLPDRMARFEYRPVVVPTGSGKTFNYIEWGVRQAKAAEDLKIYVGPKDFDVLAAVDRELVRSIDFGIFDWLAVPLLRALKGINAYVGNYGWSIIILTVLINVVMFPLRHKSVVSMKRMQELQPEIKAIQARYGKLKATDPGKQKMNQELMDLYKAKGVNPASGCVPLLLTIPIFIAFYSLLSHAIELRGAPFIFWIVDLSAHDPYYVTPILMGGAWLWQQWMTPSSADPVQQKMFLLMPVVFTVMFLWAPSGLAIYWFVNNLLGIGQQFATNALVGRRQAGGVVERRRKGVARANGN
jgi:YidC/Oxa1 family membrane protein insertase